jgi:hypothetical protein
MSAINLLEAGGRCHLFEIHSYPKAAPRAFTKTHFWHKLVIFERDLKAVGQGAISSNVALRSFIIVLLSRGVTEADTDTVTILWQNETFARNGFCYSHSP